MVLGGTDRGLRSAGRVARPKRHGETEPVRPLEHALAKFRGPFVGPNVWGQPSAHGLATGGRASRWPRALAAMASAPAAGSGGPSLESCDDLQGERLLEGQAPVRKLRDLWAVETQEKALVLHADIEGRAAMADERQCLVAYSADRGWNAMPTGRGCSDGFPAAHRQAGARREVRGVVTSVPGRSIELPRQLVEHLGSADGFPLESAGAWVLAQRSQTLAGGDHAGYRTARVLKRREPGLRVGFDQG